MVRALLAGTKTQTRRIVKGTPLRSDFECYHRPDGLFIWVSGKVGEGVGVSLPFSSPYGFPGDRLRVKEHAWMWCEKRPNGISKTGRQKYRYEPLQSAPVIYCADRPEKPGTLVVSPETGHEWGWRKKLGRFLPKWASRITLEITAVRVERLNDISEEDAIAEGIEGCRPSNRCQHAWRDYLQGKYDPFEWYANPRDSYRSLWESINGPGSWTLNPWVWVIEFKRV